MEPTWGVGESLIFSTEWALHKKKKKKRQTDRQTDRLAIKTARKTSVSRYVWWVRDLWGGGGGGGGKS